APSPPIPPSLHDALPIFVGPLREAAEIGSRPEHADDRELVGAETDLLADRVGVGKEREVRRLSEDDQLPAMIDLARDEEAPHLQDRKSTRLNSSHVAISY